MNSRIQTDVNFTEERRLCSLTTVMPTCFGTPIYRLRRNPLLGRRVPGPGLNHQSEAEPRFPAIRPILSIFTSVFEVTVQELIRSHTYPRYTVHCFLSSEEVPAKGDLPSPPKAVDTVLAACNITETWMPAGPRSLATVCVTSR